MKTIRMRKELVGNRVGLFPSDPWAEEMLDNLPMEKDYTVDVKNARARGPLNFYWAGLSTLVDNFGASDRRKWPTSRHLHEDMMRELGHTRRSYFLNYRSNDGVGWIEVPDSIALDNMTDDEFKQVFETIRGAVVLKWRYDPWESWQAEKDAEKALRPKP